MTTDCMQICSFLPSATEILYALGLGNSVAGVTFECDFPPEASEKPIVVNTNLAHDLTSAEIDRDVSQYSSHGDSLYRIEIEKLEAIKPDLIVTQELCDVCAISTSYVAKAVHQLSSKPQVLSLTPHTLGDVLGRHSARRRGYWPECGGPGTGVVPAETDRESWRDDEDTKTHGSLPGMAVTTFQRRSLDSGDD